MPSQLSVAVYGACVLAGACWVLSLVYREYSWVDRLWSVAPVLYAGWFAWASDFAPRLTLMAILVAAWGGRLTYNFARKGGYAKGGEDYRWPIVRAKMGLGPAAWQVFNVVFICGFQHALLLALTLPMWLALRQEPAPLHAGDVVVAGAFVLLLVGETVADQQQWNFQTDKHARLARGETVSARFVTTGLFRYSRHPNFFCEMGMWWMVYLFSVMAGAPWLNPTIAGPIGLVAIFLGSTPLTEDITRGKYPEYAEYQRRTSRLVPWFPG
jgi:steroid 5-alpha reductase family enzyme